MYNNKVHDLRNKKMCSQFLTTLYCIMYFCHCFRLPDQTDLVGPNFNVEQINKALSGYKSPKCTLVEEDMFEISCTIDCVITAKMQQENLFNYCGNFRYSILQEEDMYANPHIHLRSSRHKNSIFIF